jgi:hypothetical protein
MTIMVGRKTEAASQSEEWPAEVGIIISALEAGRGTRNWDRRNKTRRPYQARAILRLFSDMDGTDGWVLFSRDIDRRGLGFITKHRLPLGYGGTVRMTLPDGRDIVAHCTLLRCREATPGWYEGALYFNRPQDIDSESAEEGETPRALSEDEGGGEDGVIGKIFFAKSGGSDEA